MRRRVLVLVFLAPLSCSTVPEAPLEEVPSADWALLEAALASTSPLLPPDTVNALCMAWVEGRATDAHIARLRQHVEAALGGPHGGGGTDGMLPPAAGAATAAEPDPVRYAATLRRAETLADWTARRQLLQAVRQRLDPLVARYRKGQLDLWHGIDGGIGLLEQAERMIGVAQAELAETHAELGQASEFYYRRLDHLKEALASAVVELDSQREMEVRLRQRVGRVATLQAEMERDIRILGGDRNRLGLLRRLLGEARETYAPAERDCSALLDLPAELDVTPLERMAGGRVDQVPPGS